MLVVLLMLSLGAEPTFCGEKPTAGAAASRGGPSKGSVEGAVALTESAAPYSKSHQAGRDGDLAFYAVGAGGPVALEDLVRFDAALQSADGKLRFDVARNWALVAALVTDESIALKWIFVSDALRGALLAYAKKVKAPPRVIAAAEKVLHQPSDAPPHDDHFHVRIRCTVDERDEGCAD